MSQKLVLWFNEIRKSDVAKVGGKNASLGEMFSILSSKGIRVPDGFALTADAFWYFLRARGVDKKIKEILQRTNASRWKELSLASKKIRKIILNSPFPHDLEKEILKNYKILSEKYGVENVDVAVRSSATAEDLPTASFAGQHETYLNVRGEKNLLKAVKKCIASMFTERAIAYREEKGFSHFKVALSVGVQKMVRSDLACSGVMFTLDTETGFQNVVLITSVWGVGEMIVKGRVTPDEFYVFKPTLQKGYQPIIVKNLGRKTKKYVYNKKGGLREERVPREKQLVFSLEDKEVLTLAKWAIEIEKHYQEPQDIEWAKDGKNGELFIVQSRPETVHRGQELEYFKEYEIKTNKKPVLEGIAVGNKIGVGRVRIIHEASKINEFKKGEVLVTHMTDPDWVPALRSACAVVTKEGGRSCHAAIVSRELGIPAVVGVKDVFKVLKDGEVVTVDCTQGLRGRIFRGRVEFKEKKYNLKKLTKPQRTKLMVNIAAPDIAFRVSFLPVDGVGLAREEFIIAQKIKVHPLALFHFETLKKMELEKLGVEKKISLLEVKKLVKKIEQITVEHNDKKEYFVKELAEGIGQIAAAFWPREVIVRFSDFKTNEYRQLIGGELFEREEENPMLGWRGAARYYSKEFQPAFLMECKAIKRVRETFGLKNVSVMVPFCRTVEEGEKVLELMKKEGLVKGEDGLKVYVMAEIPSNVILADKFLDIFDGMSIGSNDLTQLVLGIDRDNAAIQKIGNENNEAVKAMIKEIIRKCQIRGKYSGICGQAPSDFPEFAEFLIAEGIKSISLNPDTVIPTILKLQKSKRISG